MGMIFASGRSAKVFVRAQKDHVDRLVQELMDWESAIWKHRKDAFAISYDNFAVSDDASESDNPRIRHIIENSVRSVPFVVRLPPSDRAVELDCSS